MDTLTLPKISELGAALHRRRNDTMERIRTLLHGTGDPAKLSLANQLEEIGDWVEADVFDERDIALFGHELAALRDIDAALLRIADGSYRKCTSCGGRIDPRRLRAEPAAPTCLACQKAFEKRRGFVRDGI